MAKIDPQNQRIRAILGGKIPEVTEDSLAAYLAYLKTKGRGSWKTRRISDKKRPTLPLAELKATERKSPSYQLLDNYSVWFVHYRSCQFIKELIINSLDKVTS
jgi:hypothetical protein